MAILTRAQILAASDLKFATVEVESWGGQILIRVMTGAERNRFEREWQAGDGKLVEAFREKMLVKCICDENRVRLFDDETGTKALGEKSASVLADLFEQCMKLNGFTKDTTEVLAKN